MSERRCHMLADGRLEKLMKAHAEDMKKKLVPKRPCMNCGMLFKPLRKGRCERCEECFRRTGKERIPTPEKLRPHGKPMAAETPCKICGRLTRRKAKGRCMTCYGFWRVNGRDRTRWTFRTERLQEKPRLDETLPN